MQNDMNHTTSIRTLAGALCFTLLVLSFLWVSINSYAAPAQSTVGNTATPPLMKPTATPTTPPTATPTKPPTPTPTTPPTATPTPQPTATPTSQPTTTPTTPPTATPTSQPTSTPTSQQTATPIAGTTPTPTTSVAATPTTNPGPTATHTVPTLSTSTAQTPVVPSGSNDPTNNGGSNSSTNGSASKAQGHFTLPPLPLIIGAVLLLSLAGVGLFGVTLLRRDISPLPAGKLRLPPSGAKPWKRIRTDELDDDISLNGSLPLNGAPNLPPLASAMNNRSTSNNFAPIPAFSEGGIYWQPSMHSVQTEPFPTQDNRRLSPPTSLPYTPFPPTEAIQNMGMNSPPSTPQPPFIEQPPPTSVPSHHLRR